MSFSPDEMRNQILKSQGDSVTAELLKDAGKSAKDKYPCPELGSTGFYIDPDIWSILRYAVMTRKPVLIKGPSGQGKSSLARLVGETIGLDVTLFNFGSTQEPRLSLLGKTELVPSDGGSMKTEFKMAHFAECVQKEDQLILMDEVTRSNYEAQNILLTLMDHQRELRIDEGDVPFEIYRNERCAMVATGNIGGQYQGTRTLDNAFDERFAVQVDMGFPPQDKELELVQERILRVTDLNGRQQKLKDVKFAEQLIKLAADQREEYMREKFFKHISTRMIIEACIARTANLTRKQALLGCIFTQFSPEGGPESERARVRKFGERHFAKEVL